MNPSIAKLILLLWITFNGFVIVLMVGRRREPVTSGQAAIALCLLGLEFWLVSHYWDV